MVFRVVPGHLLNILLFAAGSGITRIWSLLVPAIDLGYDTKLNHHPPRASAICSKALTCSIMETQPVKRLGQQRM
jgi:hypothetical protein